MTPHGNPHRHLPLAPHSFQILLSLLDGERHGYSLIKDIERRTGGETALGNSTVYAALKRMVDDGLLRVVAPPQDETSGGPPRRYYRITEYGRAVARAEGRRIIRLQEMVAGTSLLSGSRSTPGGS